MGICNQCATQRDPGETLILEKEQILKMNYFKINQIKASFFDKNEKDNKEVITYENAIKGMLKLHQDNKDFEDFFKEDTLTLQTFHSILKGVALNFDEKDLKKAKFSFKKMMIIFFLLSNSYSKDKIQETLQLEGKTRLKQDDVQKILKEIFIIVLDCSVQLLAQDMNDAKKRIEQGKFRIFKTKIDPIVEDSVKELYTIGEPEKNPIELGLSFYQLIAKLQYNAATTDGIRKVIKWKILQEKLAEFKKSFEAKTEEQQGDKQQQGQGEQQQQLQQQDAQKQQENQQQIIQEQQAVQQGQKFVQEQAVDAK